MSRAAQWLKRSVVISTSFLVSAFVICGEADADGVLDGQTIRMLVVGDPVFKSMQKMHDEMEKLGGGKIELNVLPFEFVASAGVAELP